MINRIETGIDGLDELVQGGVPENSVTLVSGGPGTGKTLCCSQFLWEGLQRGQSCLFITMEEEADDILEDAHEFGWNFKDYQEKGDFNISYINPFRVDSGFDHHIREKIEEVGADRIVIDSTSVIGMYAKSKGDVRRQLYEMIKMLKNSDVTTVMTAEAPKGEEGKISRYGVEEFVADSVIVLHYMGIGGGIYRNVEIPKIRKTNQEKGSFPMLIDDTGIHVFKTEEEYVDYMDSE